MDQSSTRSEPAATPRPSRPSRPTSQPAEPSPGRTDSSSRSTRSSSTRSQPLTSPQAPAQPTVSTSPNEPDPYQAASSQSLRGTQSGAFAAASNVPDSSSSPPTATIIAASVGGAVALFAALALYICLRRRRKSAPTPARFSNWIDDRAARTHTVYDKSETDPYASESLYALKPSDSSIMKGSPTSDGPTAFLPLPVRGRTPTDSWISSGTPSLAGSSTPFNPPMSASSSTGSPGADADFDRSLPSAPFAAAALAQRGSRQSLSPSRESPDTSPAPTPPPIEANTFLASGAASIRSSRYAQSLSRRSTLMRPVSIAPSAHGQRNSIYSVTASTIRGAPHHAHNRVEIVLPAPLDPETYVPAAPFMMSHSRTGSDRSRHSVSTYRGPAWRDHSPSPSREGEGAAVSSSLSVANHHVVLKDPLARMMQRAFARTALLLNVRSLVQAKTWTHAIRRTTKAYRPCHHYQPQLLSRELGRPRHH